MSITASIKTIGTIRAFQMFQIFRFATILLVGILLTKSHLDVRDIGTYESLIFVAAAVSFFWIAGILNGLISRYDPLEPGIFHNTAILITLISLILAGVMYLFSGFFKSLLPPESQSYYPLLILYVLLNNPTHLNEYILLLKEKTTGLIFYGMAVFIGYVAAITFPVFLGYGIKEGLYGLIIYSLFKNFYLLYLLKKYCIPYTNKSYIFEHFLFSVPLMLSMLVSGSADYVDGFLVTTHFGSDAFAIFRYGAKELPLAVLLSGAMSNAMVPKFAGNVSRSTDFSQLKKESLRLMHLLFPLTFLLLIFSNYFYPFIFREEFLSSAPVFNTFLLLLISRMVFPQTIVMAAGKTGVIFRIAIAELIINVVFSYVLLHYIGMLGIALGTLIAFYSEKLMLAGYLKIKMGINAATYIPWKTWLLYSLLLLSAYFIHFKLVFF
jgi:O-antigen/teichoic acid export membrane protein